MAKHNFGIIKATFTTYLNESENLLAKEMFGKFMHLIKESKPLRLQFEVYKNLESKYIPNENLAIKYIDENINVLTSLFKRNDLLKENEKLTSLIEGLDIRVSESKKELYNHIDTLIIESLSGDIPTNVDNLHESFSFILEHIKNNKPKQLIESIDSSYNHIPKEFLIKKAIEKFNIKFSSLNESDKSIFKSIISTSSEEKQNILSSLKEDTISSLKTLIGNPDMNEAKINESIKKISNMEFNPDTYSRDILSLNDLRYDIMQ